MAVNGDGAGPAVSRVLLSAGRGGGIQEMLLLSSNHVKKKATSLQTIKLPRSNLLDRVQNFLPQMASANAELRREMDNAPLHKFDIEHVDASTENVIEMNVALVELSGSDTEEEESVFKDDSESEDNSDSDEVTVDNFKLPKSKEGGRIEILDNKISK